MRTREGEKVGETGADTGIWRDFIKIFHGMLLLSPVYAFRRQTLLRTAGSFKN